MTDLSMNWIAQPELGNAIRSAREAKGMSQGDLAIAVMRIAELDESDVKRRTAVQVALSSIEVGGSKGRGRPARSQYLPHIERALGINLHASVSSSHNGAAIVPPAKDVTVKEDDKPFETALNALYALRLDDSKALDGARGNEMKCAIRLIQLCHDIADEWAP